VLYLGFLKFLKRDKTKEPDLDLDNMEDLDIPPLPPGMEEKDLGEGKELPELPELPEMSEIEKPFPETQEKPLPELELPPEKPAPELEFPDLKAKEGIESGQKPLLSIPELPKLEEDINEPLPPRPSFGARQPRPLFGVGKPQVEQPKVSLPPRSAPEIKPYERFERAAVREERGVLRYKEAEGPIYVKIERFRDILTKTRTIKNNLKTAGQSIDKLNDIDANRDKVFERWHKVMTDLQKKLIFIDKILFNKKLR